MKQDLVHDFQVDESGNPTGGDSYGVGIRVRWQDGPLGRGSLREVPNGAFVEGLVQTAFDRLNFYQHSKFACEENQQAMDDLQSALEHLQARTDAREARGVEGTHTL
jgi:hypothetical protein